MDKEILILIAILVIFFAARNMNPNPDTSETEQKLIGGLAAGIVWFIVGIAFLAFLFGMLTSPWVWLFIVLTILASKK
jgi:hypothetical protein